MPIRYPEILQLTVEGEAFAWDDRDAMLYALGIGMGADPLDRDELAFVHENGLKAVPTLATAVAFRTGLLAKTGIDFTRVVHGDQACVFHRPFPPEGRAVGEGRIVAVQDKGAGKGAVLVAERTLRDEAGAPLVTLTSGVFARGDGGFGGPNAARPEPPAPPERAPDATLELPTRPDQALLYRLSGDRNPLHADPGFARAVGFPRPILHGLCTYGMACRAVLKAFAGYDPARLRSIAARFSAPVFPGETVTVDLWRDGPAVSFQGRVKARDAVVLSHGRAQLA